MEAHRQSSKPGSGTLGELNPAREAGAACGMGQGVCPQAATA